MSDEATLQELADGAGMTLAEYKAALAQHDAARNAQEAAWDAQDDATRADAERYPWKYTTNGGAAPADPAWQALFRAQFEDWQDDGLPRCALLSRALGRDVQPAERDAIWTAYKAVYIGAHDADDTDVPLVHAMRSMDRADTSLWTKSGKPRCRALSRLMNYRVSARERDKYWRLTNAA